MGGDRGCAGLPPSRRTQRHSPSPTLLGCGRRFAGECGAPFRCERRPAQVDSDGRVLLRSAEGGGAEGQLVDLGTKLGLDGAGRLALLLQAAAPAELVSLDLR